MADRTVSVKLKADISEYTSSLAKAAAATRGLAKDVEQGFDREVGPAMERSGKKSGGLFARSLEKELKQNAMLIGAATSAAMIAGAPVALAGAATLFAGIGGLAAAQTMQVRTAWTNLGHDIREDAVADASALVPVYEEMASKIGSAFQRMRPELREAFEAAAPQIERFTDGLTQAAENALPGLVRAVQNGGPVVEGLATLMERVGTGLSDMFDAMSDNSAASGEALAALGDVLAQALPLLGELLGTGAEIAADVLPPLADALGVVASIAQTLGPVLPAVVTGFVAMKVASTVTGGIASLATSLTDFSFSAGDAAKNAGLLGRALPMVGLAMTGIALQQDENTARIDRYTEALLNGGRAAAAVRAEVEAQANSGLWERFKQAFTFDDEHDIEEDYDKAAAAAKRLGGAQEETTYKTENLRLAHLEAHRILTEIPGVAMSAGNSIAFIGNAGALTEEQITEAVNSVVAWRTELQTIGTAFVEPLNTYRTLLEAKSEEERKAAQATADMTVSSKDSWRDYLETTTVTLDQLAVKLEEQIAAQQNWRANIVTIAQRGGFEVAQAIAAMGQEGVELAAQMANGTDAEFNRMAAAMIEDARLGGAGAAAELDAQMRVMAAIGASGGKSTAQAIAAELGIGVNEVARIAAQYGVQLAGGVNPLLQALGKGRIRVGSGTTAGVFLEADGGLLDFYAKGGVRESHTAQIAPAGSWRVWAEPETGGEAYIPLASSKRGRSLDIWRETGRRLNAPEAQYFATGGFTSTESVPRPPSTAPYQTPISTAANATMEKAYGDTVDWVKANATPPLGPGIGWQAMMAALRTQFPGLALNSGFRPGSITATGNLSYHAAGRAVDVPPRADVFEWIYKNYFSQTRELIYSPMNGRQIWNGKHHMYSEPTRGDHFDHVHWAMANGGVIGEPVLGMGLRTGATYSFGEQGPETVTPGVRSREFSGGSSVGGGGGGAANVMVQARVFVGSREITDIVRVEAEAVVDGAMGGLANSLSARGVHA